MFRKYLKVKKFNNVELVKKVKKEVSGKIRTIFLDVLKNRGLLNKKTQFFQVMIIYCILN